ncbi:hypothetical protein PLESTB_001584800 [Pleodorina starrii]|uniref:Thioredoxin domain-containing protein n=1 Tax=Pleodorina starrii TaxID=330485 RepID=A0A9W6BYI8_9CHLO|nr:hypothetical protein PLESTM_000585600 [Pleodorina starrii]GLC60200.1 hypothetical protein PLESTB_001584800 [Pleodorina starrii]
MTSLGLRNGTRCFSRNVSGAHRLSQACKMSRRCCVRATALHIDRRSGLESAWRRQEEAEARQERFTTDIAEGNLITVPDAAGLDTVIERAGSQLVVVFLFSRQCGVCKDAAQRFEQLRNEAHRAKARVVFVQHDVETDYGDKSDLSRLYNVRAVPCFLFFDGGAVVSTVSAGSPY